KSVGRRPQVGCGASFFSFHILKVSTMKNVTGNQRRSGLKALAQSISAVIELLESRVMFRAETLTTDKLDYSPGNIAILTASNLQVGETVQFHVTSETAGPGQDPWVVSDGITDGGIGDLDGVADGSITTSWQVD